jgi:tetratricopeptide (TPR) repeat protein
MKSPRETLEFLERSLRSLDADTLASVAESLAQQAHEAGTHHRDMPAFLRLEERFLDIAIRHAEAGREFARQARLLSDIAEMSDNEPLSPARRLESARAWVKAGKIAEARRQLQLAVESAVTLSDMQTLLQVRVEEAIFQLNAEEDVVEAVSRTRPIGEEALQQGCGRAYLALALAECRALVWAGHLKQAEARVMETLQHAPEDSEARHVLMATRAKVWSKQGQPEAALGLAKSAVGDKETEGEPLEALGQVYADYGLHSLARATLTRAVDVYHEQADRFGKARVSFLQAKLRILEARWAEAEAPLSMAETEFRTLGHTVCLTHSGLLRAEMLFGQGKRDEAEKQLSKLLDSRAVQSSLDLSCAAYEIAGDIRRWNKRYELALLEYRRSRDAAAAAGMPREHARGALNCSHMHLALNELALAETQATLALGLVRRSFGEGLIEYVESKLALARVALERGNVDDARKWTVEALEAGEDLDLLEDAHNLRTQTLIHDLKRMENLVADAAKG